MIDFIICKIEDGYYAFNLDNVQRIIESKDLTNVSDSSIYIDGIMTYENQPIEIINLRRVLNFKEYKNEITKILIYKHNDNILGLIVDAIENIVHLNESEVEFMETGTRENNLIDVSRVVEIDNTLVSIVNNINIDTIRNQK